MGNLLGVKQKSDRETVDVEEGGAGVDYKKSAQFADHMGEKSEAASDFARTHTMRQQREFLPVYAVKEEMMTIIRDNSVIIVVGETGSGKTTQLTQVFRVGNSILFKIKSVENLVI